MRSGEIEGRLAMDTTERWLDDIEADPIQAEAADWLLRLQSASASQSDKNAFLAWMDQDARHASTFSELFWTSYRAWAMSNARSADVRKLIELRYPTAQVAKPPPAANRRRAYAFAASIVLVASLFATVVHFVLINNGMIALDTSRPVAFDTPVGENRTVVLADTSRLTLGGRTRLEVALSEKERAVTLLEGEAYFEIAKEQTRKFKVHVGALDVTAVGTTFNVKRSNKGVIVTVTEGAVLVTPKVQRARGIPRGVRLSAGEQATATNIAIGSPILVHDLASITSWRAGQLSFRQYPLREAIDDVNRYAQKPLVLAPEVDEIAVTGTLMINNIGSWVKSLEHAFNLTATEEPDRIVIRPGRRDWFAN